MYLPDLTTWMCLLASGLWLTAGLRLFMDGTREGSRPDFVLALGLISGGILLGTGCTPWAGEGVFPLAGLMLAIAGFWAFGLGLADEATGLQRGERGLHVTGAVATVVAFHFAARLFGAQPTLDVGFPLRPFEPLVAGLLVYLWLQSRQLPAGFFLGVDNQKARSLLWATAGASAASFFGGPLGDGVAFALLSLAAVPIIAQHAQARDLEVRRCGAIAAAGVLIALGLAMADHLARHQTALQRTQSAMTRLARSHGALQTPVSESVDRWVGEQPQDRYTAQSNVAFQDLARLRRSSLGWSVAGLAAAVNRIEQSLVQHVRWSMSTFQSVEMRHATLGDDVLRAQHQRHALTEAKEAALALDHGREALADLQRALVAGGAIVTEETERLGGVMLALLVIVLLLGGALLGAARVVDEGAGERAADALIEATATDLAAAAAAAGLVSVTDGGDHDDEGAADDVEPDAVAQPLPECWLTKEP